MFKSRTRRLAGVAIIAVLAVSAFGYAAANTVPDTNAGDGDGAISGYAITNVDYLLASNAANLVSVDFDVTPANSGAAPSTVKAKVVSSSTTYATCSNSSGTRWSCPVGGTVLAADELRVIAAD